MVTAVQLAIGEIGEAAISARRRLELLAPLPFHPDLGLESRDAYQMASETSLAAGDIATAQDLAERILDLRDYREEQHLATPRLLAVDSLTGRWDRVLLNSLKFQESWERAGRPRLRNLSVGAAATAMVHGLRGDDEARAIWSGIVAELRGDDHERRRSGYGGVFDSIVLLHRGRHAEAVERLQRTPEQLREWFTGLWRHWYAALWAEAAVLANHPEAEDRLGRARFLTTGNPVATAMVERVSALASGERDRMPAIAAALDAAGCVYQAARTRALGDGDVRSQGQADLAALGAAPMA
jgi:hypothetical protein